MFWRRKTSLAVPAPAPASTPPSPSHSQLQQELDACLDATAEILRARARYAFPVGEDDARSIANAFERWACHLLVRSPPPLNVEAGEHDTGAIARDFRGVVDFVNARARKEQDWVLTTTRDMRDAIFALVDSFRAASASHGRHDVIVHTRLANLHQALASNNVEALKREAVHVAAAMSELLEEQRTLAERQTKELRDRLTALGEQLEQRRREGETDPLTQLGNRRAFDGALARALTIGAVTGRSVMLVMIDVDHFKAFNDAYGHPIGDLVLRAVADALARAFPRRSDVVARYGGEEFSVILSDAGLDDVPVLERRLLSAIRQVAIDADGRRLGVTASAGIAVAAPNETPSELLARADRALYAAKDRGRDRVVVCALTRPGPTLDDKSDPEMQPG